MTEKDELIELKYRLRGALAGFAAVVAAYEAIDEPDEFARGKLEAYRLVVTQLSDISK